MVGGRDQTGHTQRNDGMAHWEGGVIERELKHCTTCLPECPQVCKPWAAWYMHSADAALLLGRSERMLRDNWSLGGLSESLIPAQQAACVAFI